MISKNKIIDYRKEPNVLVRHFFQLCETLRVVNRKWDLGDERYFRLRLKRNHGYIYSPPK